MLHIRQGEHLVLASGSPRRKQLLSELGLTFETLSADIDETVLPGEAPEQLVRRLALAKAAAVASQRPDAWILGADTIVVIDGMILGKPGDTSEAAAMLSRLQGRVHHVFGGVAIINPARSAQHVFVRTSAVQMIALTAGEISAYIQTGEPMDKAGSYAIQGIGAHLVAAVEGSYTNVVGLDISAVVAGLRELGVLESLV